MDPIHLYVDCEFEDSKQSLISVGICTRNGDLFYAFDIFAAAKVDDPWVKQNVIPILLEVPPQTNKTDLVVDGISFAQWLEYVIAFASASHGLLRKDALSRDIVFHVDFPTDVTYISKLLHLGEGKRIGEMKRVSFEIDYVDAYPTTLNNAVQHNAAWDALALKEELY